MIAQKNLEVDTDFQKIGTDMIAMFKEAKEENQTENRLNQDFSQNDDDVKKKKKVAARALGRKKIQHNKNKGNKLFNKYCL